MSSQRTPRVALVYPPYGPLVPGLGIAILSAGIKKLGFECRTFHWNVDFIRSFPAKSARRRVAMHHTLSYLFPLNEWVFVKHVFPESDDHDPRIAQRLANLDREKARVQSASRTSSRERGLRPSEWIPKLRAASGESLDRMAEQLSSFDIIGISSTFFQNMAALALAKKIKATSPDKIVVLGGANCDDLMGVGQLTQFGFIDVVSYTSEEFDRNPDGCVKSLVDGGIIYVEDEMHLTLPVSEPHRPRQLDRSSDLSGTALADWLRRRASAARTALGDLRKGELDRAVSAR